MFAWFLIRPTAKARHLRQTNWNLNSIQQNSLKPSQHGRRVIPSPLFFLSFSPSGGNANHTWGLRTANTLIGRSPSGSTSTMVSFRCPWVIFKGCGKFRRLLQTKLTFLCRLCSIAVVQTSDPFFVYLEQNSTLHILAPALCPLRYLCFSVLFFFSPPFSPSTAKHHEVLFYFYFLPREFSTQHLCK